MTTQRLVGAIAGALITAAGSVGAFAATDNLVFNGNFETGSGLGQIGSIVSGTGWTNTNTSNFNFILDATADDAQQGFSGGFTSVNSADKGTNIFVWGPDNGVYNGFRDSANGGKFLGGDGGWATGTVTQTISGLTVGQQYTLNFEWAGAQFTDIKDSTGKYWVGWDVSFAAIGAPVTAENSFSVGGSGSLINNWGFQDWATASHTFTASATTQVLSFLATGPSGLPPFSLLDGVTLTEVTSVPEPASLALMLAGGALLVGVAKRRRQQPGA